MDDYEPEGRLFRALMHPARLELLDLLRDGEHCVCHLEAALGYRQAYISQQLMVLRDAGLVQDRREGWNVYYRVVKPAVFAIFDAARTLGGPEIPARRRKPKPRRAAPCPCPQCNSTAGPAGVEFPSAVPARQR
jgi:ArsR family transcriptional regulator